MIMINLVKTNYERLSYLDKMSESEFLRSASNPRLQRELDFATAEYFTELAANPGREFALRDMAKWVMSLRNELSIRSDFERGGLMGLRYAFIRSAVSPEQRLLRSVSA